MSRKFLVCIDESIQGRSAFDTALSFTKTDVDLLILANIRPSSEQRLYQFGFDLSSFEAGENEPSEITLQEMEKALGGRSQAILYHYAGKAKAAGVVNVKLLSIISDAVGPSICDLAVEEAAEVLVLGRRGMGTQRRERLGGTAQYVMQHAQCAVVLAPERDGPAEAHVAKKFIIYQEEVERRRRVTEHDEEEKSKCLLFLSQTGGHPSWSPSFITPSVLLPTWSCHLASGLVKSHAQTSGRCRI